MLIAESGNIVNETYLAPFGEVALESETVRNNFRFPGQYHDRESMLYYNWNRYYMPSVGRYNTVDPLMMGDFVFPHTNFQLPYTYVNNSPTIFFDFSGFIVEKCRKGYHGFLCIDGKCWGFYPAGFGAIFYGGDGYVNDDTHYKSEASCKEAKKPECCTQEGWEKAIADRIKIDEVQPPPYHVISYNCWNWLNDMLEWGANNCKNYK